MAGIGREEALAFRDQLRRLLAARAGEAELRRVMETPAGYDPALWLQLAELGLIGLVVEAAHGGTGAGPVALELAMEEVGAALLPGPLLGSGVLAAGLVAALGDAAAAARLLPGIADGSRIAAAAVTGPAGTWTEAGVAVAAAPEGGGWALSGTASFVLHGQNADVLLVAARTAEGIAVFEADPHAARVAVAALPTFDHSLRLAECRFSGTPARRLGGQPGWAPVEAALDLARVAMAGEQAGAGRRVLEMTVEYAKARIQFGRPIGSFQAIKHMAADLLLESESAISAARHAAEALEGGTAGAAVHLAGFACAEAFTTIAATAIQMHGGIAFTWDHPAHLYLRRARADAQLLGAPAWHRERYLQALGA